jgi:hypothetical protein
LPARAGQRRADRRHEPGVGIGDDQLHPGQATGHQADFGFGVVRQLLETRVIRPAGPSGLSGITFPLEAEPSAA